MSCDQNAIIRDLEKFLFVYRHSAVQSHHRRNTRHLSTKALSKKEWLMEVLTLHCLSYDLFLTIWLERKKLISSNINISSVLKSNYFRKICLKLLFFSFQALKKDNKSCYLYIWMQRNFKRRSYFSHFTVQVFWGEWEIVQGGHTFRFLKGIIVLPQVILPMRTPASLTCSDKTKWCTISAKCAMWVWSSSVTANRS